MDDKKQTEKTEAVHNDNAEKKAAQEAAVGDAARGARPEDFRGPLAWMCQNHVAANLFMLLFIVGG